MSYTGPTIIIADLGGANTVTLTGVSAPYPIPQPQSEYGVEASIMRAGAEGAGLRVLELAGKDLSHEDLEFTVAYLTQAQHAAMKAKYDAQPAQILQVTLDGGSTWWSATFQKKGYDPGNWTQDWRKQNAKIALHISGAL